MAANDPTKAKPKVVYYPQRPGMPDTRLPPPTGVTGNPSGALDPSDPRNDPNFNYGGYYNPNRPILLPDGTYWAPPTQSAGPQLPSSNGANGSHDNATIQAWLKSQGIADKDLQYWTDRINSKSDGLSQANADYWSGRIGGGAGGDSGSSGGYGGGLYGPQNTYTPLSPFGGIGGAPSSSYNPGGISAPAPYQYQPIQGMNPFSFPGVYQPQAPRPIPGRPNPQGPVAAPAQTPKAAAQPPADPSQGSPFPNGILVNGGWRDKNDPSPDVQAVVQQYQTALQQYQATQGSTPDGQIGSSSPNEGIAPNQGQIGSNGGGDAWYYAPGGPGGPPASPGGQIGSNGGGDAWYYAPGGPGGPPIDPNGGQIGTSGRGSDWYYAPGGPGGPPLNGSPSGIGTGDRGNANYYGSGGGNGNIYASPNNSNGDINSLYAAGLTLPTYRPPSPFQSNGPASIPSFDQSGQIGAPLINTPTPLSYSPLQNLNTYQSNAPLNYGSLQAPGQYQTPDSLKYDALQAPGSYQAPTPLSASALTTPDAYTPNTFTAPTAEDAKNDPGYQFRLDQGSQALQQSAVARGGLLSSGTARALNDYGQQSASQEYNNVYARQLAAFQAKEAAGQSAYGLNTGTQLAAQAQQYGQAANTQAQNANQGLAAYQTNAQTGLAYQGQGYSQAANTQAQNAAQGLAGYQTNAQTGLAYQGEGYKEAANTQAQNAAQALAAYQTNAQTGLAYQGQQYGQAAQTQAQNAAQSLTAQQSNAALSQTAQQNSYANALAGYQTNAQTQLAQQNQSYNQAANTYGMNAQTGQNAYALNAQTQLGAQNQAFNQAFNSYNANAANSFQVQQANAANAFQVYQGNFGNQLNAYQASTGAQYNAAALNAQSANQAWQNDYTQAWNTYQSQVQQQEAAAGLGFQYANLGLQQQGQYYNQAANTYGMNYNSQYQQPFNNNLALAQLGYGAASNPYGANYANNAGNLYTGIGNANAAGQIGAGNAWANGLGGAMNAAQFAALYPQFYPQPSNTPPSNGQNGYPGYGYGNPYGPPSPFNPGAGAFA